MAARVKGEVGLSYEGQSYTVVLDFNALADFEDKTGKIATQVLDNSAGMSVSDMRALMWAGLLQNHPEITLQEAGRILTSNVEKLSEAIKASFPDAEVSEGNAKGAKRPSP